MFLYARQSTYLPRLTTIIAGANLCRSASSQGVPGGSGLSLLVLLSFRSLYSLDGWLG